MAISVEQRSKFATLHRQWQRLQMSEKFLMEYSKQTQNRQRKPIKQKKLIKQVPRGCIGLRSV